MQSPISGTIMPVRRDLRFRLPVERSRDWHVQGSHVTQFFNALSLQFPAGERFFMDSVRNYRDRIADPKLKQQVQGFIGQEAMHTREHVEYNEMLVAHDLPARRIDRMIWRITGLLKRVLPHSTQLAITMASEHYTAMLANWLLSNQDLLDGSVDGYKQVWIWHAFEETEHKAVSFDVWNSVVKPGLGSYLQRVVTYVLVSMLLWGTQFLIHVELLVADRRKSRGGLTGCVRILKLLFAPRTGIFPHSFREFIGYFRPGFHPWDYDNRHFLKQVDDIVAHYDARPIAPMNGLRGATGA